MKKKIRNILLGTGIAVSGCAAYVAMSYSFTKKFVKIALDRETPKTSKKSKSIQV